jgi:O-antigen ligase
LLLVGLGVAFGPQYVVTSDENRERFTWVGAHPLLAGLVLSVALVIVAATPGKVLRMPPWMRAASGVVFVAALVPNHSRQSWLGLAVALVVALVLAGRLNPLFRWIGAPLIGAGVVAGVIYAGPQLWDYVLRNEESEALGTGNGRLGLWSIGYRALDTPFDWMAGLGHGITRTVFVAEEPWARTAHSSFLAVLVATGLIGMFLFLATLVLITRNMVSARLWEQAPTGLTLTLLYVVVLLNAVVADSLAEPTLGFAMLYLIAAVAAAGRERRLFASALVHAPGAEGTRGAPVAKALRP